MPPFRRILVPRDFSEPSERALAVAVDLAERTGADLHLLHAQVLHSDPFSERQSEARATPVETIRQRLEQRAGGREVEAPGEVHTAVVRDIAAAPAILRYAEEHDADLIVLGTHGRRGVRRVLLGSVAEEVVRATSCGVLAVRQGTPDLAGGDVLVPVDFSTSSRRALQRGKELAALFDATLHVLHVAHLVPYPSFYGADLVSQYHLPPRFVEEARDQLHRFISQSDGPDPARAEVAVMVGQAERRIADYARDQDIAAVVMGTRGLSGLENILLGSVTERTLRLAPCSVYVTKLPPGESPGPVESFT